MAGPQHLNYRVAYLSLQAVAQGQDSWGSVNEIICGFEGAGWQVTRFFPEYSSGAAQGFFDRVLEIYRVQRRLLRAIKDYDLIYARGHVLAWPVARAAARQGIPVVQECNGTLQDVYIAWPGSRMIAPLLKRWTRSQYASALLNIAVTDELAAWVNDLAARTDAVVSSNGANVEIFRPDLPRRQGLPASYAVFFGQLARWQGVSTILDAVSLNDWPAGVSMVVVGEGVMRPEVEAAAALGNVLYLGRLPYEDVAGVVVGAAASLIPIYSPERAVTGFSPMKLYESMACGVPVVVSDAPGMADTVRECECGIVVPAGDSAALARAVAKLAGEHETARAMGRRARDCAVDAHSWGARARERMRYIEHALSALNTASEGGAVTSQRRPV